MSPPPPPPPPVLPPFTPPPFEHVDASTEFNECQTTCFADEFLCRDGGPGSFSPALCPYSTSCVVCGPRQQVTSVLNEFDGDDSCQYANDGFCKYYAPLNPQPNLYSPQPRAPCAHRPRRAPFHGNQKVGVHHARGRPGHAHLRLPDGQVIIILLHLH